MAVNRLEESSSSVGRLLEVAAFLTRAESRSLEILLKYPLVSCIFLTSSLRNLVSVFPKIKQRYDEMSFLRQKMSYTIHIPAAENVKIILMTR